MNLLKHSLTLRILALTFLSAPLNSFAKAGDVDKTSFKKPSMEALKSQLTPLQFEVTQEDGTEPPFKNQYWNNKAEGIYVDLISGEPLFSSTHKFKSGTGWPSFYQPLESSHVVTKTDSTLGMTRTEVRSKLADSHLGHVFKDGPKPTGLRYCINSAALRFIPKDQLTGRYAKYQALFAPDTKASINSQSAPKVAYFASGCFWCSESDFEKIPGVLEAESGYMGGELADPTYRQVSNGGTGHAEMVRVTYDAAVVSYAQLVSKYWHSIDPTVKDRQFCDIGTQYRSVIFYNDEGEKKIAEDSLQSVAKKLQKPIYTQIVPASTFYRAEEYHQDYYKKNPDHYKSYRKGCGRDARVRQIWGQIDP